MLIDKKCKYCGKLFKPKGQYSRYVRKFCSQTCSNKFNASKLSKDRIGEKNPMYGKRPWNYIDGKSGGRKTDARYWIWRRKVLVRDNYQCRKCKKKLSRNKLVAHHIKPWADYPKLRYDVKNGMTLCRKCHNKIDHKISRNLKLGRINGLHDYDGKFLPKRRWCQP